MTAFKQRLQQPGIIVMPGVFNAALAKLVEAEGFEAGYITGAGLVNASTAKPDVGLLSLGEVAQQAGYIADAVSIPMICDADTGFGEEPQVKRTVELLEKAGLAGIHLEDQVFPKRCGHLDGKAVIEIDHMVSKLEIALKARKHPDFAIIARVDSRSVTTFEDTVDRAKAYAATGVDMIFIEALTTREEFAAFAKAVPDIPLMANMTEFGKTPYLSAADFEALGYKAVLFPMTLFRVAMKAAQNTLRELKATGTQQHMLDQMQTRQELYELLGYEL